MKKILYNNQYGGFGFSDEVLEHFGIEKDKSYPFTNNPRNRTNKEIIEFVEKIGLEKASGECCKLAILEADDDDIYEIESFDGKERLIYRGNLNNCDIIF